jgi:hypothetical protein
MNQSCLISIKTLAMFGKIIIGLQVIVSLIIVKPLNANAQESVQDAINLANTELWKKFIDQYGIIHDFVGEVPTPEDCTLGKPNAMGWWSPIENGPFFTGLYLSAACERARRSGSKTDRDKAKRLADGLLKCASVSNVTGFVTRGVGTDGQCHYPLGSVDQTIPWYLGLYSYLMSDIPTTEHRQLVMNKLLEVTSALYTLDWKLPCDGHFKGEFRGDLKSKNYLEVTSYLFVLRMMHQLTLDNLWIELYRTALFEHPRESVELPSASEKTRIEICAAGYRIDSVIFTGRGRSIDKSALWIYVKNQATLAYLVAMENDQKIKAAYRIGLELNASNAMSVIGEYENFDNNDTKVFGHTKWREGYSTWFPQKTQADGERLSQMGDKEKLGPRKNYERIYMTNPLAAAAIIALAGDRANREIIESVISHFDYSKMNMSEFFFAEVAYYAFPFEKNKTPR